MLLLVGLLFALSAVGVDLTALSVLGGALGVGLGFGLQKLAANYVSGFVILFERCLRIGDTVRVDNFEGAVMDIKTRYTLIRALHRPRVDRAEREADHRADREPVAGRSASCCSRPTSCVGYDSDVDAGAGASCCEAALAQPRVMRRAGAGRVPGEVRARRPGVHRCISGSPTRRTGRQRALGRQHRASSKGLRAAGIDIPYPQRVVRVESLPAMSLLPAPAPRRSIIAKKHDRSFSVCREAPR